VAVLDAEPLDELGRIGGGLRELLADAFGERRGERIDLPDVGFRSSAGRAGSPLRRRPLGWVGLVIPWGE
jgi:hypothetical protein